MGKMKTYEKISLLIFAIYYLVCEGGVLGNDIKKPHERIDCISGFPYKSS